MGSQAVRALPALLGIIIGNAAFFAAGGAAATGTPPRDPGDDTPRGTALERREEQEERARASAFALTPHRQNYVLLVTYDRDPNAQAYEFSTVSAPKQLEAKFQLSLKMRLMEDLPLGEADLYAAYTQLSFWQVYDKALSSPFRETNYEPEVFLRFDTDRSVLGLRGRIVTVGLNHESNGQVRPFSRSWNRIFATCMLERGGLALAVKAWWRIPESAEEDDNPDLGRYLGYGELEGAYSWRRQVFSFLLRNNLRTGDNRGAAELGWSFPLSGQTRGYLQYFYGYGESLIDYYDRASRISLGVMLFDWL